MLLPDPVDEHASRQGMCGVSQPLRERQPPPARWRPGPWGLHLELSRACQDGWNVGTDKITAVVRLTASLKIKRQRARPRIGQAPRPGQGPTVCLQRGNL